MDDLQTGSAFGKILSWLRIIDKPKGGDIMSLFSWFLKSRLYTHTDGTLQYDRVNNKNRTVTYITSNNYVKSIRKYHNKPREVNKVYKHFKGR